MQNARGKTFTIFIILTLVLLVSSTSIGFFLYHQEKQLRKQAEDDLETSHGSEAKLQAELKEAKRELAITQDKAKEADDKINNLMDEADLNDGLRKELKTENASLKEQLEAAKKDRDKTKADVDAAEKKYKEIMELFKAEQDRSAALQKTVNELQQAKNKAESEANALKNTMKPYDQRSPEAQIASEVPGGIPGKSKVELDKIVVNPDEGTRGRILSIDKEAEFIVCNMGSKQGIKIGDVLSVYRGEEYLGDVRVSRVQEELAAADVIPPFSSRKARKNDIVVFKP